ncbi:MAG: sterol desaturase family protein [Acidobacteria bacterium]|nr:sterol desaturase family protein [Acidobacteriota bacterium]
MTANYIALAIPAFFVLILVEWIVARRLNLAVYRLNDAVTDLACGMGQQAVAIFGKLVILGAYASVYANATLVVFEAGSWWPWVIAFFGVDLMYYWWHRASHEVAFLWAIHAVHHQSEDYNLAVALRQAWFSGLSSLPFYLPLALLGVPLHVFATVAAFSTLYQFWIHTETIGRLGPIEWVLNTASHHRVHHGRNPRYLDRNYAATLIIWDRLFGSFQIEDERPLYGVIKPYRSWNPVWANFDVWLELWKKARRTPRWLDRLRLWFASPGWTPPGVAAPAVHNVESEPRIRYRTETPLPVGLYVLTQFPIATLALVVLMVHSGTIGPAWSLIVAVLIVMAGVVWGGLFEAKRWAVPLEIARLAVVAAIAAYLASTGSIPWQIAAAVGIAGAGFAVAALRLNAVRRPDS